MRRMRPVTLCGLAMLGLALGIGAASAEDKTFELKLSHWVPPSHPLQKALEDWGAAVEQASNGTLRFKVFPAQQLGKAFDHYDMARDGIADHRGRDGHYWPPPAQIRTRPTKASGSYLGCLTSKRSSGQG